MTDGNGSSVDPSRWSLPGRHVSVIACLLFASLILYAIRVRGEAAVVSLVAENVMVLMALFLLFDGAVYRWLFLVFACLALHKVATLPLVWTGVDDLSIASEKFALVMKCIVFGAVAFRLPSYLLLRGTVLSAAIMTGVFYWRLSTGTFIDEDNSFAAGLSDRNYMGLMLAFLLFAAVVLCRLEDIESRSKRVLGLRVFLYILHIAALLLAVRAGSRSSILSILLSLWLLRPAVVLVFVPIGALLLVNSDFASFLMERLARVESDSYEEYTRIAQIIAAGTLIQNNPLGLLTGFGLMASHHVGWFEQGFAFAGLSDYFTVIHNSPIDLVLAFGVPGLLALAYFASRLPLMHLAFFVVSTSFINVLGFVPFYLALAVSVKSLPNKQRSAPRNLPAVQPVRA